jgi:hypothetical protein
MRQWLSTLGGIATMLLLAFASMGAVPVSAGVSTTTLKHGGLEFQIDRSQMIGDINATRLLWQKSGSVEAMCRVLWDMDEAEFNLLFPGTFVISAAPGHSSCVRQVMSLQANQESVYGSVIWKDLDNLSNSLAMMEALKVADGTELEIWVPTTALHNVLARMGESVDRVSAQSVASRKPRVDKVTKLEDAMGALRIDLQDVYVGLRNEVAEVRTATEQSAGDVLNVRDQANAIAEEVRILREQTGERFVETEGWTAVNTTRLDKISEDQRVLRSDVKSNASLIDALDGRLEFSIRIFGGIVAVLVLLCIVAWMSVRHKARNLAKRVWDTEKAVVDTASRVSDLENAGLRRVTLPGGKEVFVFRVSFLPSDGPLMEGNCILFECKNVIRLPEGNKHKYSYDLVVPSEHGDRTITFTGPRSIRRYFGDDLSIRLLMERVSANGVDGFLPRMAG